MTNKSYAKGYRFERKVKKHFEDMGWYVVRQGKSAFPDLICIKNSGIPDIVYSNFVKFVECKMNKYLSRKEKEDFKELIKIAPCYVAWKPSRGKIDFYEITEEYLNH